MNNFKSVLYWALTICIIIGLWPILKWLILILVVLAIYLFYRLKKSATIHTFNLNDDFMQNDEFNNFNKQTDHLDNGLA